MRLLTPAIKYWVCKSAPGFLYEAMECLGGNGYVEENVLARHYREAPVNSTWEGSGNVQCVDVLRAIAREPRALECFMQELDAGARLDARLAAFVNDLRHDLERREQREYRARTLVGRMALALQAALLLESGNAIVADAFCAARLGTARGMVYGELPASVDCAAIIARASPT